MVTAPCRVVIDAAVEAWILNFQRVVTMQLQVAKSRWKHNPQTNITPVVKWAQRYMRDRQLVASPFDKEFGFCLETLEAHSDADGYIAGKCLPIGGCTNSERECVV